MAIPQTFLDDPFLTPYDIKGILKVSRGQAYNLMYQMNYLKVGKLLRVRQSDFQRWLEERAKGPYSL
jgi:hypothetical protein